MELCSALNRAPEDGGPGDFPRGEFQCTCSTSTAGYFITERGVERSTVWDMDMVVKGRTRRERFPTYTIVLRVGILRTSDLIIARMRSNYVVPERKAHSLPKTCVVGLAAVHTVSWSTVDRGVRVGAKRREKTLARELRGVPFPEEFLVHM